MKKTIICLLFWGTQYVDSNAQKGSNYLKIHAAAEFTTGLFADGYNTGWGVYATDYIEVAKGGSFLLSIGIAGWKASNDPSKAGMFLTRIGYRQFVSSGLYMQGEGGLGFGQNNFSGSTKFVLSGGFGYLFKGKRGNGFDICAKVNRGFIRTWIDLGAGYQLKL